MRWGRASGTNGDRRGEYNCLWGNRRERSHLDDLSVDGRIILEWILKKEDVGCVYRIYLSEDTGVEGSLNIVMNIPLL